MNKKRVLFIVNGLGLGNSTRCSAVIHELCKLGYKIDVITSSNGLNYYHKSTEVDNIYSFQAILYGKTQNKLSVVKTFLMTPRLLVLFIKNCIFLNSLIKINSYEAIVFDSDYTVVSLLWKRHRPLLIAVNNAVVIVNECKKISNLPRSIRMQYWIEKLDYWFHNIVPDQVVCPRLSKEDQIQSKKIKCIPPIVRAGLSGKAKTQSVRNILVMLSGSQFGSEIHFLSQLPNLPDVKIAVIGKDGVSKGQIHFFGKIYNNQDLMNTTDMLIINAGFSAISEAVALKTPAIVIPIDNHAEQYINALLFEKYGLGLIATQENAYEKIVEMFSGIHKYIEAHIKFNAPADGAKEAARLIDQSILVFQRENV